MFNRKVWTDRVTKYPNRFIMTDSELKESVVTLERNNGDVSSEGEAFNAQNMNDLEDRIGDAFESADEDAERNYRNIGNSIALVDTKTNGNTSRIAKLENYEEITFAVSSWRGGSGSAKYPYYAQVAKTWAIHGFVPLYIDMVPNDGGGFFSDAESDAKNILNPNVWLANGVVTIYSQEVPKTTIRLRVGGV